MVGKTANGIFSVEPILKITPHTSVLDLKDQFNLSPFGNPEVKCITFKKYSHTAENGFLKLEKSHN